MPYIYLTYTRDAASCLTFGGRTAEADAADRISTGRDSEILPPPIF
ncbi:MAG: hypothetical protein IKN75_07930 [Prevotella sp.]|nr:hypothetical protein [Prevotella sp.]